MRILVLVKHLPDHRGLRRFTEEGLVDRAAATGMLGELDEYSLEQALRLRIRFGGEIVALCVGSPEAEVALTRALRLGADRAVHVTDPALRGQDALATSRVLAAAVRRLEEDGAFDLLLTGMSSTDSYMGTQPTMLAERLGLPALTFATQLDVDAEARTARIHRGLDDRHDVLEAPLPALVSITDQAPLGRTPHLRDVMRAEQAPRATWSLAELGLAASATGREGAAARIASAALRPARPTGRVLVDDGQGSAAAELAEYLLENAPV